MENKEEKNENLNKNTADSAPKTNESKNIDILIAMIIKIGAISLMVCIILLLAVHFISPATRSEITADGILEYLVGTLAFISTLILSGLALWQTHKIQKGADEAQSRMEQMTKDANDISVRMESLAIEANRISQRMEIMTCDANNISRKMLEIEEYNYKLNIRPFINVGHFSMDYFGYNDINNDSIWVEINGKLISNGGKYPAIVLSLINTTKSVITVQYEGATSKECEWTNAQINPQSLKHIIKPSEAKNIIFFAKESFLQDLRGKKITLSFILENRFAQRYKEKFDIVFSTITRDRNKQWHYLFHTQEFQISKYSLDEYGKEIEMVEDL